MVPYMLISDTNNLAHCINKVGRVFGSVLHIIQTMQQLPVGSARSTSTVIGFEASVIGSILII